ncbi:hypothetical protein ACFOW0_02020, partial [Citroniella saccharovorans]
TKILEYLNDGFEWVVDIDLEKFFDKVPQDKLMSRTPQSKARLYLSGIVWTTEAIVLMIRT